MSYRILVTGSAGFIGYHLCRKLLLEGHDVLGYDNLNPYYDVNLKKSRLYELKRLSFSIKKNIKLIEGDLKDMEKLKNIFSDFRPEIVINLAAQAGVRYSLQNPHDYVDSNLFGFLNILECCRNSNLKNFIYASSSSVYGGNTKVPFNENDTVDHPVSLYAATKRSNELMAHSYSHLFSIPSIGLRFFTVYGPWGRPDMAPMIFTKSIIEGKPISVFNHGQMKRDFTYIDDITETIVRLIDKPPTFNNDFKKESPEASESWAPHKIFNIGNSESVNLAEFINTIEDELGIKAIKKLEDMQKGDVKITFADTTKIENWTGFKPKTPLKSGIKEFIKWYKNFYKLSK